MISRIRKQFSQPGLEVHISNERLVSVNLGCADHAWKAGVELVLFGILHHFKANMFVLSMALSVVMRNLMVIMGILVIFSLVNHVLARVNWCV